MSNAWCEQRISVSKWIHAAFAFRWSWLIQWLSDFTARLQNTPLTEDCTRRDRRSKLSNRRSKKQPIECQSSLHQQLPERRVKPVNGLSRGGRRRNLRGKKSRETEPLCADWSSRLSAGLSDVKWFGERCSMLSPHLPRLKFILLWFSLIEHSITEE